MTEQPTASLAARDITRSYGANLVLDGVDLVRSEPGVIGLIGPNGSGKTTLLRVIAQLVEPDSGTLEIAGHAVERGDHELARAAVGWMPHDPLAWREESVERNLQHAARLAGQSKQHARAIADASIHLWGLADVRASAVRQLSRGWAQRYSLARADLLGPPILLLDEPTTGLDAAARRTLEDAIDAWRHERIVVIASHEREWLEQRCDELMELAP